MKHYTDFTTQYVQDICDALKSQGIYMNQRSQIPYDPDNFATLTTFLQDHVVMPAGIYSFLDDKGLVNRGHCPYTAQKIDKTFPKWTYMNSRSIYVSHEGYQIMQKEDAEEYQRVMGRPKPQGKSKGGCYIATVCYGNELAPEVVLLKRYRDEVLSNLWAGRQFIKFYYAVSPKIADTLRGQENINNFIRTRILDKLVNKINKK